MNRLRCLTVGSALVRMKSCTLKARALSSIPQHTAPKPHAPTIVAPSSTSKPSETKWRYTPEDTTRPLNYKIVPMEVGTEKYEGAMVDGKRVGFGKLRWSNGTVYEGNFADDKMHGSGKLTRRDKAVFVGQWVAGRQDGEGTFKHNGRVIKGTFLDGFVRDGFGTMSLKRGGTYTGEWKNFHKEGWGEITHVTGKVSFKGEFHLDKKYNGIGSYTTEDGVTTECTYVDGVMHAPERRTWLLFRKGKRILRNAADAEATDDSTSTTVPVSADLTITNSGPATPAGTSTAATITSAPTHVNKKSNTKAASSNNSGADAVPETGTFHSVPLTEVENGCTGKGVLVMENGRIYSGTWLNGTMVGPGKVELKHRPSIHVRLGHPAPPKQEHKNHHSAKAKQADSITPNASGDEVGTVRTAGN